MSAQEAVSVTPVSKKKDNEERISVASNWTLIWWRFKKHRLAVDLHRRPDCVVHGRAGAGVLLD